MQLLDEVHGRFFDGYDARPPDAGAGEGAVAHDVKVCRVWAHARDVRLIDALGR